jgi:penicillin-binding protein 1A
VNLDVFHSKGELDFDDLEVSVPEIPRDIVRDLEVGVVRSHSTSLVSNDVRAWPVWNEVDIWTSPKRHWRAPSRLSLDRPAEKVAPIVFPVRDSTNYEVGIAPPPIGEDGGFRPIGELIETGSSQTVIAAPEPPNQPPVQARIHEVYLSDNGHGALGRSLGASAKGNDPAPGQRPKRSKRSVRAAIRNVVLVGLIILMISGGFVSIRFVREQISALPPVAENAADLLSESSVILAADGSQLGQVFGERRTWVNLNEIAPEVVDALLSAEDHRFFEHNGIDYFRMMGAAWNTLWGDPEGASTITMQLARNSYPAVKEASLAERKVREIVMARRISKTYTKEETLELYLNTVAFGNNSFGIEAAAKRFFTVSAADLSLSQASLLVGILKGPSRYNPLSNAVEARKRRNLVLSRMQELGFISSGQFNQAASEPLRLNPSIYDPLDSVAPHFVDYVRKVAEKWAADNGYDLKRDGLIIQTTLDPYLQGLALQAVTKRSGDLQVIVQQELGASGSYLNTSFWRSRKDLENDLMRKTSAYQALKASGRSDGSILAGLRSDARFVDEIRTAAGQLEAGLVAIDPHNGQVKAWVGGRDYASDQFDKVSSAARQPGSVFKPFLYAAALEAGFSPYYLVEDRVKTFVTGSRGERWTPSNSGGGASGRLVTMRQGLTWSKNTVSAHLVSRVGPQRVIDLARKMGITSPMMPVPSIALGTSETTLLEMVHSYATFAEMGIYRNVSVISSIQDRHGAVIATFPSEPRRALSAQTAYTTVDMLRNVIDEGTGSRLRTQFGVIGDLAGKTGTTQNNADGWFIGMHPDLVVGAWVGFNDQRIAFQSNYWGQGGHNALLLVGDFMRNATKGPGAYLQPNRFPVPEGYRYPAKPVYSRPEPEEEDAVGTPIVPVRRMTPRVTRPIPLQSTLSNR